MLIAASLALGFAMAVAYHGFMTRSQLWLSHHSSKALPLLSVGSLFLRLTFVGIAVLLLYAYTPLNIVATAGAFVGLFSVLNVYSLIRLTAGWSASAPASTEAGN